MNTNAPEPPATAYALPGIEEKRFLVTGATSGIGLETARLLADLGATVAASGRRIERLTADVEVPRRGRIVPIFGDLSDPSAADAVVASAVAHLGPLDGLVHSAGIIDLRPLRMTSAADLERLYRINVEAGVLLAKAFRRKAARRDPASIVFVSSVMGLAGDVALAGYCASKGALLAAGRALALELAPEGIRVNCVAPGQVRTPMWEQAVASRGDAVVAAAEARHPLGFGEPIQVAWPIVFLLSDAANWITGATLPVDGGYVAA